MNNKEEKDKLLQIFINNSKNEEIQKVKFIENNYLN